MVPLPDDVRRWVRTSGAAELSVLDLDGVQLSIAVGATVDGNDLLMPIPEGQPVHHALIYDPQAVVLVRDPADGRREARVRGEVEMTTAGARELAMALGSSGAEAWLVVRVVPVTVDVRG